MTDPKVSIIMSTYNDEKYIRQAIDSVVAQTFKDWEFIIVNDASTDQTAKILGEFESNEKIKVINNPKNEGLASNLNKALAIARGQLIARQDGDDVWLNPNKLEKQVLFLSENPEYVLVGTLGKALDTNNNILFDIDYPTDDQQIRAKMLVQNCFLHSTVIFRKNSANKLGNYSTEYSTAEDYDLWLKLGTVGKLGNLPEKWLGYRINPLGTSKTKYQKQIDETLRIISKYKSIYPSFLKGYIIWSLRRYYPVWFRGAVSRNIKKLVTLK